MAMQRGYALTTLRSAREKNDQLAVIYACDRSGRPPSTSEERQRKTTTIRTGCPFSVLAKESINGSWALRHRPN